nr:class A beta-lactamase [Bacteroidota bacterium]
MHLRKRLFFLFLLSFLFATTLFSADTGRLRNTVDGIVRKAQGTIGVAIHHLESGDTLTVNGSARLPMQSVYKYPLGLAVLRQVDLGTLS